MTTTLILALVALTCAAVSGHVVPALEILPVPLRLFAGAGYGLVFFLSLAGAAIGLGRR